MMPYRTKVNALLTEAMELIRRAQIEIDSVTALIPDTTVVVPPGPEVSEPVVYGKDSYTDEFDPRLPDATRHSLVAGKVSDIHLMVHVKPNTKYRCTKVYVLGEEEAEGKTIATVSVYDKEGGLLCGSVVMATGYQGNTNQFDDRILSGDKVPCEHIITAVYSPPNLGPLAIYVCGDNDPALIDSDVVGSLGLPGGRHVSFVIEYHER
jgi:hypothetical protein